MAERMKLLARVYTLPALRHSLRSKQLILLNKKFWPLFCMIFVTLLLRESIVSHRGLNILSAALALGGMSALSPVAHAVPVSASMSLTAHVSLEGNNAFDPQSASWGVPLSPLAVSSNANVTNPASGASITAQGSGIASWGAGGNSGSVIFSNYGWSSTPGGTSSYGADLNSSGPDLSYTFIADGNGTFSLTYNVTASGNKFGLQGWDIGWTGLGGGLSLLNVSDPTTSGLFSRALLAGQSYTLSLQNNANISCSGPCNTASMNGTFDFNIVTTPVPEPGTLGLLSVGLAGLGALRRRRKNANKAA